MAANARTSTFLHIFGNVTPCVPFQFANVISAALWATAVLAPGRLAVDWLLD
jgi:membrane protein DedA with SNARE-associated domain